MRKRVIEISLHVEDPRDDVIAGAVAVDVSALVATHLGERGAKVTESYVKGTDVG